jgi:uncharacterized protein
MLAFDYDPSTSTNRRFDADGRLHVERSVLSRAQVDDYLAEEIPHWREAGLRAGTLVPLFRDPDELRRAAPSFDGVPLMSRHVPTSAADPQSDLVIGCVMRPSWEAPDLMGELVVWDEAAIRRIQRMDEEGAGAGLSCGYRFQVRWESGSDRGMRFAGRMCAISGNHVALVDRPRVAAAQVGDAAPARTPLERAARFAPGIMKVSIGPVGYF